MRTSWSRPVFAFATSMSLLLVPMVDPSAAVAMADGADVQAPARPSPVQSVTSADVYSTSVVREAFVVVDLPPPPPPAPVYGTAPAAGVPDPGSAQAIAYEMVLARGWGDGEYSCLVSLWNKESGWNQYAHNRSSGAYGIPQALPGEKMASAGADWATNPATQIAWGLGYISGRYGSPCGAWGASQQKGWY